MTEKTVRSTRFGRAAARAAAGLTLLAILVLAACGGKDGSAHGGNTPAASAAGASAQQVTIALSDFKITASQMTFVVGVPYRFVITNMSKTPHEFAIAPPMPMGQAMSDAEMHKAALLHVDANELPTGKAMTVIYTFTDPAATRQLEFGCHIIGHYDAGMHTPITVTPA
ncbi:MAG: hypothetical protein ACR2M3_22010 [Thermomicrobiales bacterium]